MLGKGSAGPRTGAEEGEEREERGMGLMARKNENLEIAGWIQDTYLTEADHSFR